VLFILRREKMFKYLRRGSVKTIGSIALVMIVVISSYIVVAGNKGKKNNIIPAPTQSTLQDEINQEHEIFDDEQEVPVLALSEIFATERPVGSVIQSKKNRETNQTVSRGNTTVSLKTKLLSEYGLDASWVTVSDQELYYLAKMIECESRWEPYNGKIAVGIVILNRVRSSRFPNTITGVLFQRNQFSPMKDGAWQRMEPGRDSYRAALEALSGTTVIDGVNMDQALFFIYKAIAGDTGRRWFETLSFITKIGNHDFYGY